MEKYVRVSELKNEHPKVFTAEEIADNLRGNHGWKKEGDKYVCLDCWNVSRDCSRFCKYCGARKM